jgi:hypothetical protein
VRATSWRDEQDEVIDDRAGARWRSSQEAWREAGPCTRGMVVCPQNHRKTVSWFGPQNQVRRPNAVETGSGRVGKLRGRGHAAGSHGLRLEDAGCGKGVAVRWQDPQTLHKCPCVGCIAGSGVRGSRVISHTGGTRYISHECVWMALSLRDLGFHFPPPLSHFSETFSSPFSLGKHESFMRDLLRGMDARAAC